MKNDWTTVFGLSSPSHWLLDDGPPDRVAEGGDGCAGRVVFHAPHEEGADKHNSDHDVDDRPGDPFLLTDGGAATASIGSSTMSRSNLCVRTNLAFCRHMGIVRRWTSTRTAAAPNT